MSDQELQAFLEEIAVAVRWEARATRACIVVTALAIVASWWLS